MRVVLLLASLVVVEAALGQGSRVRIADNWRVYITAFAFVDGRDSTRSALRVATGAL